MLQKGFGKQAEQFEQENNGVSGRYIWVQNARQDWGREHVGERQQEWEDMNMEPPFRWYHNTVLKWGV